MVSHTAIVRLQFKFLWSGRLFGGPEGNVRGLEGHLRGLKSHMRGLKSHLRGSESHLRHRL